VEILKSIYDLKENEFRKMYFDLKKEGLTDGEICERLFISRVTLNAFKDVYGVETVKIRKNKVGVTEEHFRKGAEIGLTRRMILRRVREGIKVDVAIITPKQKGKRITHRGVRK
jgi:hypothetical protein